MVRLVKREHSFEIRMFENGPLTNTRGARKFCNKTHYRSDRFKILFESYKKVGGMSSTDVDSYSAN